MNTKENSLFNINLVSGIISAAPDDGSKRTETGRALNPTIGVDFSGDPSLASRPNIQPVRCLNSFTLSNPRPSGLSKNSVYSNNNKIAFRPPRSAYVMSGSDIVGPRSSTNCSNETHIIPNNNRKVMSSLAQPMIHSSKVPISNSNLSLGLYLIIGHPLK